MTASSIDGVLFDLDGTLLDSIDLILAGYRHCMEVHLGYAPPDERWLRGIGTPLRKQLADFAPAADQIEAMRDTFAEYVIANHDAMSCAYPGTVETVRALHERGLPLGLVTSKIRVGADRGLRLLGLEGVFGSLVCADTVERHKPDPLPVHQALGELGLAATRTIFVGDSTHDLQAGRAAGVQTAAALWGPFPEDVLQAEAPDYLLDHPSDVLPLVLGD